MLYLSLPKREQIRKEVQCMNMKRIWAAMLALTLALSLCAGSLAETAGETPETETQPVVLSQELLDAQAQTAALQEALSAYKAAKTEAKKQKKLEAVQKKLDELKAELDAYVAAGVLTQEQADLILAYYTQKWTAALNGTGKNTKNPGTGKTPKNGRLTRKTGTGTFSTGTGTSTTGTGRKTRKGNS